MRRFALLLAPLLLLASPAVASEDPLAAQRAIFIELRPQAELGNWSAVAPRLAELDGYPLVPDLRAAWLRRRLGPATDDEMAGFLERHAGLGFAASLRLAWARSLARRGEWSSYLELYESSLAGREDTALDCLALEGRLVLGPDPRLREDATGYWLSAYSQPEECDPVFEWLGDSGAITPALRHERITLALEAGQIRLARYLARPLGDAERKRIDRWARMQSDPAGQLMRPAAFGDSEDDRRLVAYGFGRLARQDPLLATERLPAFAAAPLGAGAVSEIRDDIALTAARRFLPEARNLLGQPLPGEDILIGQWRARLALRALDWEAALDAIAALPEAERERESWRYWWAWALAETGREAEAEPQLVRLAGERDYYGFLSADRLGLDYAMRHVPAQPDETVIAAISARPDIIRARELYLTGLYGRGRIEWNAAMETLSESERIQASVLANRWGWHSRAIRTASRHGLYDDLELRFPLPWQDDFLRLSERVSIDPTWAYGVARSESLFMPDVASRAGAIGLMQLMPATGKATARKNGIRYDNRYSLMDPAKNIALGTSYLAEMLARFDNNRVLATAAYNAGPHRVERWLPEDRTLPAAIWVENIPFKETRGYVRRVLAAETVFAWRLTGRPVRLSARMPPIPRRAGDDT
jgi:soluble lytic murein transglycosylase